MNRLGKILTLGLEKKRAWQLPLLAGLLVLWALAMHYVVNKLLARQLDLVKLVEIGDLEGVRYVCKWDKKQANREGEVTIMCWTSRGAELGAEGMCPFFLAVEKGHIDIVKMLIKAGIKVNAKNGYGRTPLHYAAREGWTEEAEMLIEAGADVNAKEWGARDKTPLHWAAEKGHTELAKILTKAGANVNARYISDQAPLDNAVFYGHTEMVKVLINAGANVNMKHEHGRTPLHTAQFGVHIEIARALIEARANVNVKDKDGWTPLDLANYFASKEMVELLRKHGAKTGKGLDAEAKQNEAEKAKE